MKRCGVVAEFNPFHNGHAYFLDAVRANACPDGIVCVMSGDFVQRGMPAYWDKWTRARAAVACGADLVVELPTVFALGSAREFALGGVAALKAAGCDGIAFGSESGDLASLRALADKAPDPLILRDVLAQGLSYPNALAKALGSALPPNDLLAVEYLRRAGDMEAFTVRRSGEGHAESASALRDAIAAAGGKEIANALGGKVPAKALAILADSPCWDAAADTRLFAMLRYAILAADADALEGISAVSEGLQNVLKRAVQTACGTDDLIKKIKSKRYTYARVTRILMQVLLGITDGLAACAEQRALTAISAFSRAEADRPAASSFCSEDGLQLRVLAFNDRGAAILRERSENAPGVFLSSLTQRDVANDPLLSLDARAADVYSILTGRTIYSGSDLVQTCKPEPGSI